MQVEENSTKQKLFMGQVERRGGSVRLQEQMEVGQMSAGDTFSIVKRLSVTQV